MPCRCADVSCPRKAGHRLLSYTWKPGTISKFAKRAQSAKHLQDNTRGGLNWHLTLALPLPLPRSLFSCVEPQVKTATVAFLLAPKADSLISFRKEPLGFVYLIQYLCSVYVSKCKTVSASNKQDTQSPDTKKIEKKWKKRIGWRGKQKLKNKSIKGKPARRCLWFIIMHAAGAKPARNYILGKLNVFNISAVLF